jgi:hypothetical protein
MTTAEAAFASPSCVIPVIEDEEEGKEEKRVAFCCRCRDTLL